MTIGDLKKIGITGFLRADKVHLETEQLLQVRLQPEESIGQISVISGIEFVKKIDITVRGIEFVGCCGTE